MKIITLLENTTESEHLHAEHGLSLHIESNHKKIMFDFGKTNQFARNAKQLGVDLSRVDYGVLSHDHYDHGGGLETYLSLNTNIVYMNKNCFGERYSIRHGYRKFIGLDKGLQNIDQFEFVDGVKQIDDHTFLVSGAKKDYALPSGNDKIFTHVDGHFKHDTFEHELHLVIKEGQNIFLFAGCAHSGILNILAHVEEALDMNVTHIISGLHMYDRKLNKSERSEVIFEVGNTLKEKDITLYTGHCTGDIAYHTLKQIMGDKINRMRTGSEIMVENCDTNCKDCEETCGEYPYEPLHHMSQVKKVYGIVSGKGGVGKSLVTSMIATAVKKEGYEVGIIDADVLGPSIQKSFGIKGRILDNPHGFLPLKSKLGINVISTNMLLPNDTDPVIWKGPLVSDVVKQFWSKTIWEGIDYMFIDLPPGTGDIPLTVFQSIPLDGIIIVTSPQELVGMIVEKAVKMANMLNVPVVGVVENMSHFICDSCDKKHYIYGESKTKKVCDQYGLKLLAELPIDPDIAKACDDGNIELYNHNLFEKLTNEIIKGE